LPTVNDSLALAARSYDAGQIGLPDLLVLRRELFDARLQHLDALLEAALARIGLDASAGVLR
jgi:cobalt-zinc-cadmium efflux system outer membrane protein